MDVTLSQQGVARDSEARGGKPPSYDVSKALRSSVTQIQETSHLQSPSGATRILLVDDDEALTGVLKAGLEQFGFSVETFNNPEAALASFVPDKYDLAVLDFRMQPMNGFELFGRLRALDAGLVMCFLTAYADEIRDGPPGVEFLKKPISMADLVARLKQIEALV